MHARRAVVRDDDAPEDPSAAVFVSLSGGTEGAAFISLIVTFTDQQGTRHQIITATGDPTQHISQNLEGTFSLNTDTAVKFSNCDNHGDTSQCILEVTTAPK